MPNDQQNRMRSAFLSRSSVSTSNGLIVSHDVWRNKLARGEQGSVARGLETLCLDVTRFGSWFFLARKISNVSRLTSSQEKSSLYGTPACLLIFPLFFFNDTATTEIYTLSLHDALPILLPTAPFPAPLCGQPRSAMWAQDRKSTRLNSSHPSISYAVFCLKKKKPKN